MKPLKLLAEDADDLKVISAALQDAVVKVGDIAYEPQARRLTLAGNRFCWESAGSKGGERVRTALQLAGVTGVQARGIRRDSKDALTCLLAVEFEPSGLDEDPGGSVIFRFAGDADLKVEVECLDAVMADVSSPWPTPRKPGHE